MISTEADGIWFVKAGLRCTKPLPSVQQLTVMGSQLMQPQVTDTHVHDCAGHVHFSNRRVMPIDRLLPVGAENHQLLWCRQV